MKAPAAISGAFADFKLVKGRKVAQIVVEVPIEHADEALAVLGGLPRSDAERWVALARLNETPGALSGQGGEAGVSSDASRPAVSPPATRKSWADMPASQQAAIRCGEPSFGRFLQSEGITAATWALSPNDVAVAVRSHCGVASRKDLDTHRAAKAAWHQLDTDFLVAAGKMAAPR